jgi:hypothetical protein
MTHLWNGPVDAQGRPTRIESGIARVAAAPLVPQPDPRDAEIARLRAALQEAVSIARTGRLVPPDGGSPTEAEVEMCDRIADRIAALVEPHL